MPKGEISILSEVWCGGDGCAQWDQLPGRNNAKKWRKMGWKRTTHRGWLCPDCKDEAINAKTSI